MNSTKNWNWWFPTFLQVVDAIKKILYATDDDASVVAEAQAMLSHHPKEAELLSPIAEVSEERNSSETQKRKNIVNFDVEAAGITTLSPRQRISDASDVHCSGSPLMTYWLSSSFVDVISFPSLQKLFYRISCLHMFVVQQVMEGMCNIYICSVFQSSKLST